MTSLNRGPAKIYAFPARGRFATNGQQNEAIRANLASPLMTRVSSSSSWYHDEAIREAEKPRKN